MDDALLPDTDRDLALARALEARGEAPGAAGPDALGTLLARLPAAEAAPDALRAARLRARVMASVSGEDASSRTGRTDRAARPRARAVTRWAGAGAFAAVLVALAVVLWPGTEGGGTFAAPATASVTARLGGGSVAVLSPGAHLARLRAPRGQERYRLDGRATFDVAHRPDRVFEVEAGGATVAVLGTRFTVATRGETASVALERGSVKVTARASGQSVRLAPGERTDAGARVVAAPTPADGVAETAATLSFRRAPASDVARALERRLDARIELPADVARETVSGTLALDGGPPGAALDAFARTLGGHFTRDGRVYRFAR